MLSKDDSGSSQSLSSARSWKSDAYLAFVRSRPCVVTGRDNDEVVAHHVRCLGGGGVGLKPPDWMCVPIIASEHAKLHQVGERSYWESHSLNPLDMICMTMLIYLAQNPSADVALGLAEVVTK